MSDFASPFDWEQDKGPGPIAGTAAACDRTARPAWRLLYERPAHCGICAPLCGDNLDERLIVEITSADGFEELLPRHLEALSLFVGFVMGLIGLAQHLPLLATALTGMVAACTCGFIGVERTLVRRIHYRTFGGGFHG